MSEPTQSAPEERVEIVTARLRYVITGEAQGRGRAALEEAVRNAVPSAEERSAGSGFLRSGLQP